MLRSLELSVLINYIQDDLTKIPTILMESEIKRKQSIQNTMARVVIP